MLRGVGRSLGSTISDFYNVISDIPDTDMVFFERKHVYCKNHGLCGIIIYDRGSTIILEIK